MTEPDDAAPRPGAGRAPRPLRAARPSATGRLRLPGGTLDRPPAASAGRAGSAGGEGGRGRQLVVRVPCRRGPASGRRRRWAGEPRLAGARLRPVRQGRASGTAGAGSVATPACGAATPGFRAGSSSIGGEVRAGPPRPAAAGPRRPSGRSLGVAVEQIGEQRFQRAGALGRATAPLDDGGQDGERVRPLVRRLALDRRVQRRGESPQVALRAARRRRGPAPAAGRTGSPAGRRCWSGPASPAVLAMPKSVSRGRPSASMRTLPGLTSRCWIPARCTAWRAASRSMPDPGGLGGGQRSARRRARRACRPRSTRARSRAGPRPPPRRRR